MNERHKHLAALSPEALRNRDDDLSDITHRLLDAVRYLLGEVQEAKLAGDEMLPELAEEAFKITLTDALKTELAVIDKLVTPEEIERGFEAYDMWLVVGEDLTIQRERLRDAAKRRAKALLSHRDTKPANLIRAAGGGAGGVGGGTTIIDPRLREPKPAFGEPVTDEEAHTATAHWYSGRDRSTLHESLVKRMKEVLSAFVAGRTR